MKEKIERLSKGIFEYEQPEIVLSQDVLNLFVSEGEVQTGSFVISNSNNTTMKGLLYSSSNIVKPGSKTFNGVVNEVNFSVNCKYLEQGERIEGRINIVSDCGERQLPFTVSVLGATCKSSIGQINNFFSFQSLAQANWNEALELFDSKQFYDSVVKCDDTLNCVYETLKASPDRNLAMEEFLYSHKKKAECSFYVENPSLCAETEPAGFVEKIVICKSTWGYLKLQVESDLDFVTPVKRVIENSDFVNGRYELKLVSNPENMSPGVRYGEIRIFNALHETIVPVTYRIRGTNEKKKERKRAINRYILSLFDHFLGFRCGRISKMDFINESVKLTEALENFIKRENVTSEIEADRLDTIEEQLTVYRAYLAVFSDRSGVNDSFITPVLLKKHEYESKDTMLYAALLFIEALYTGDEVVCRNNYEAIKSMAEKNPDASLIRLMYMYTDPLYKENYRLRYESIMQKLEEGSNSIILLSEVGRLLSADPGLIRKAGVTECRLMLFMIDNHMADERVTAQFVHICRNTSERDDLRLRVLEKLYSENNDKELLRCICEVIIRLNLRDVRYHTYFKEAVRAQMSLVNLFEFYMFTYGGDREEEIDQPVLLYYSYNTALPEDKLLLLYAYIVKTKEENMPIYKAYFKNIEQFAVSCLKERKINDELAVLYSNILNRDLVNDTLLNCIPDVLFSYCVETKGRKIANVVVSNNVEISVGRYPVENGRANVLLYTDSCTCWLEDDEGNRYLLRGGDICRPYMHMHELLTECYEAGSVNPRLLLFMWEKNIRYNESEGAYIALQKQISGIKTLKPAIANLCSYNLAEYYYINYEGELLEAYLNDIDIRKLDHERRNKITELMIVRNMHDKVIEYVKEFGCENLSLKRLAKLCLHAVEENEDREDREIIVSMSHYAFRNGNVEDRLLKYIVDNYNGTTAEMYEIWHAAKQAGLDTAKLEENLLAQILFTESYIENSFEVFKSYYMKNNNRKLVRAFISYTAYKYFVSERVTENGFFEILKADPSLENSRIGILALLKYYSEKERLTAEEKEFADTHIRRFLQKKVFYAFFKDFGNKLSLPGSLLEKTYVEYRTDPKKTVYIHYSYDRGKEFRTAIMPDVGYGIFTKEFILFYGEVLQYFITESDGEKEEITESNSIACLEDPTDGRTATKYDKINNILIAAELKDDKTVLQYLEQYYLTEYAVKRHFKAI